MKSVMRTDSTGNFAQTGIIQILLLNSISLYIYLYISINHVISGAATIRLEMPSHMQNSLIFHYNLKFYGNDTDNYDGISLKRFVMQVYINGS